LPAYPNGVWYFNPFAWQLLFVFGAWCALGGAEKLAPLIRSRIVTVLAVAYLVFSFLVVMTWHVPQWAHFIPTWLAHAMYPIDKSNADILRVVHFLAIASLTIRFLPREWPPLSSNALRPLVLCGQHSLPIFCLGTFLAFVAHIILVEVSNRTVVQILVALAGIALLVAAAWLLTWFDRLEDRGPGPGTETAGLAAGQA